MNDEDAEALLAAVLSDEVATTDPRVVALLCEQPWREAELAAARAAQATVRAANQRRLDTLAEARGMTTAPGDDRLAPLMAQHVAALQRAASGPGPRSDRGPAGRSGRTFGLLVALAAALLVVLFYRPWQPGPGTSSAPVFLGSDEVAPLAPSGEVHASAWPTFRWQGKADSFRVVVFRAGSARQPGDEICRSPAGIVGNEWQPDAQATAKLATQARIEWELQYEDSNGGGTRVAAAVLLP